jgi:hypothetical protein
MSSLAWSATEEEAVDWARAIVALLPSEAEAPTKQLATAIRYPAAAGPATEVLLNSVRARHADAPAKEAGTSAGLSWIAEKYPNEVVRPICPPPPQPTFLSDLKCPVEDLSVSDVPKDTKNNFAR